jgi:hypothetical protein
MDPGHEIRRRRLSRDSDEDEEEFDKYANLSIWSDFCQSVYESRYISILACFLGFYCAYQITIAPYKVVRPVLTEEQKSMESLVINTFSRRYFK